MRDRLGTPLERFTIVPGAVDVGRFHPPVAPRRPRSRLLYHGRVDRRKGVLDLLEAMARLPEPRPALTVSGIGPDLEAARARAAELGVAAEWLGPRALRRRPGGLPARDVFVSPTYAEGFSNTILEAMATGLPVVSCRSVGVVDCLRDGENGLLVEAGDVEALAGALQRVLTDDGLRARLAATALAEARGTYAWAHVGQAIMDVYDRVTERVPVLAGAPAGGGSASAGAGGRTGSGGPAGAGRDVADVGPVEPCRFRAAPHLL